MNVKIGLFGGTFDPIHNGHIQICESFLKSEYIDGLWIIPASIPPQKEQTVITSFDQRFAMLKLAFQSKEHVRILDIEDSLPKPNVDFKLCIGADSLKNIHSWYKYQELLLEIDLLVVSRPAVDVNNVENIDSHKINFVKHTDTHISSTEIREALKDRRDSKDVPKTVLNYILQNDLYIG